MFMNNFSSSNKNVAKNEKIEKKFEFPPNNFHFFCQKIRNLLKKMISKI